MKDDYSRVISECISEDYSESMPSIQGAYGKEGVRSCALCVVVVYW